MKRSSMAGAALAFALCGPALAADGMPTAEAAVENLLLGECISSVTGAALPAASLDSRVTGQPVGQGVARVPTGNGMVIVEHSGPACYIHARGLDAAAQAQALQAAITRTGAGWEKVEDRITRDNTDTSLRTFVYALPTPDTNPRFPVVVIYYPLDSADRMTVGVTLSAKGAQ